MVVKSAIRAGARSAGQWRWAGLSIAASAAVFVKVYVGAVKCGVAARGGVFTCEIPVAEACGAGLVQVGNALKNEDELALPLGVSGGDEPGGAAGKLILGKGFIDAPDEIFHFFNRAFGLTHAFLVNFAQEDFVAGFFAKRDRGLENEEFAHLGHVYPVAVRVTDLGGGGGDDEASWIGTGEDAYDGLAERGAANNGVVHNDEVVALVHGAV